LLSKDLTYEVGLRTGLFGDSLFPAPDDIIPKSGVLYKATYASCEKGEKLAKQVVGIIVQIARQELGSGS